MFGVRGAGQQTAGQELEQPQGPDGGGTGHGGHRGPGQRGRNRWILVAALAVIVIIAGTLYAVLRPGSGPASYACPDRTLPDAAVLRVESVTPATSSTGVNGAAPVMVQFNGPLKAGSPNPVIQPAVAGTWTHAGDSAIFTPATAFRPSTRYTIGIPAGIQALGGARLGGGTTAHFTTGGYSQLRLGQLLAQLGYLPMTWSAATGPAARAELASGGGTARSQAAMAFDPPAGTFAFQAGYPAAWPAMWTAGQPNVLLNGAVYAFEHNHGMLLNADLTPALWTALFKAAQVNDQNTAGYTYALASKTLPESLTIWHNGTEVFHSLANTGIPVAQTANGTFPVYQKFRFQIMRGTNPDGSSYSDPVSLRLLFQRGRRRALLPAAGLRLPAEPGLRRAALERGRGCVPVPHLRQPGHGGELVTPA